MSGDVVLEVRDIVKDFPGLRANDHISFQLHKGEILALLGENGAGKTTLMNMIMGIYKPDSGEIYVRGQKVEISSPRDASKYGIGMVHQHFKLVHNFTVTENIILGSEPGSAFSINMKQAAKRVKDLSEQYGLAIDVNAKIEKISVGMQQRTEILKMLYRDADILIFDEPTAVLMPQEIDELIAIMKGLAAQGKSIILITHKLKEIAEAANRCVIIRRGRFVESVDVASTTTQYMADRMVGREVHFNIDKEAQEPGKCVLSVRDLCVKNDMNVLSVDHMSFDIHEGEIVGIAGVDGNGQAELVEAITGLRKAAGGKIVLNGTDITDLSVRKRIGAGLSHIPEDRQRRGLVLDFSVEENIVLGSCEKDPFSKNGILNHGEIRSYAEKIIKQYDVRSGEGAVSRAGGLSGGNQQKAIVGREIERPHHLLVAFQPIRGMDIGSIEYIHSQLLEERRKGKAILLVSMELDEVLQLSDRILAINRGRLIGEISQEEADEYSVGRMMAGMAREEKNA